MKRGKGVVRLIDHEIESGEPIDDSITIYCDYFRPQHHLHRKNEENNISHCGHQQDGNHGPAPKVDLICDNIHVGHAGIDTQVAQYKGRQKRYAGLKTKRDVIVHAPLSIIPIAGQVTRGEVAYEEQKPVALFPAFMRCHGQPNIQALNGAQGAYNG